MSNNEQFLEVDRQEPPKLISSIRSQKFVEIYDDYDTIHAISQAERCIHCGNPYCEWACPVHNYIPNWLKLVAEGNIIEAAELSHKTNSLPEVCGRVCPQDRLCEQACTLEDTKFGAVTIGAIERFITDKAMEQGWKPTVEVVEKINKKVAVIGAGPAGIACATELAKNGVEVTIYDKYPEIGGLLTFGIPEFKLKKSIVQRRHQLLNEMGIRFVLQVEVGKDIQFNEIEAENDAVFLGLGIYTAVKGNFQGESLDGVYKALDYLVGNVFDRQGYDNTKYNYPFIDLQGKKVVILGGGDTAMDCCRTAIRQRAKEVIVVYRRDKVSMPGSRKEIDNAIEEGVEFLFNHSQVGIIGVDTVSGIKLIKTQTTDTDESGRSICTNIEGSEFDLDCDAVVVAFGFTASSIHWLEEHNIAVRPRDGLTVTDTISSQTHNKKVFAGGDMVRGSSLVVEAISDGQRAANSILEFLDV